jgi:hypothetical protein
MDFELDEIAALLKLGLPSASLLGIYIPNEPGSFLQSSAIEIDSNSIYLLVEGCNDDFL